MISARRRIGSSQPRWRKRAIRNRTGGEAFAVFQARERAGERAGERHRGGNRIRRQRAGDVRRRGARDPRRPFPAPSRPRIGRLADADRARFAAGCTQSLIFGGSFVAAAPFVAIVKRLGPSSDEPFGLCKARERRGGSHPSLVHEQPPWGYADGFGRLALSLDRLAQQEELLAARSVFEGWERLNPTQAPAYSA